MKIRREKLWGKNPKRGLFNGGFCISLFPPPEISPSPNPKGKIGPLCGAIGIGRGWGIHRFLSPRDPVFPSPPLKMFNSEREAIRGEINPGEKLAVWENQFSSKKGEGPGKKKFNSKIGGSSGRKAPLEKDELKAPPHPSRLLNL